MPKNFRDKYPQIPWREIASFRNVIAHEYFGLDMDIVWDIIQTQIPVLVAEMRQIKHD